MTVSLSVKIVVIGGGPGGYTAAFRAADILKEKEAVAIIDMRGALGGVCLHEGCIPSKSLLHLAAQKRSLSHLQEAGLAVHAESWDLEKLREYQKKPIDQLSGGLSSLAQKRQILVFKNRAECIDSHRIGLYDLENTLTHIITFEKLIIANGSTPISLPFLAHSSFVGNSTDALNLKHIPKRLLIVGAGIIGLELGQVYAALGSNVTIIEAGQQPVAVADPDLVNPLVKSLEKEGVVFLLQSSIVAVVDSNQYCTAEIKMPNGTIEKRDYDFVLQCIGRKPHNTALNLNSDYVELDSRGFIKVHHETLETKSSHIFAIGDCVGDPMLAHKAMAQAKVAAERACGHDEIFDHRCIPSVVYTNPEVAWVGQTELQLKEKGIPYKKASFPWTANGRAIATRNLPGYSKLLIDPASERILGAGIVGTHAGDLIAEMGLAIEMGAVLTDLVLTIHPHPSFSETVALAGEMLHGSITDLIPS